MHPLKFIKHFQRGFILILTPLLLLPLPLIAQSHKANCAYIMLVMMTYWISNVLHLAVVAMFPMVFFPLFGIMDTNVICMTYMKDTNAVYLACVILGIAIEHCNLHRRIALLMLLKIGTSPRMLLLGVMLTTMSISMWIMNTVAAAMMIPIVEAIFENLEKLESDPSFNPETDEYSNCCNTDTNLLDDKSSHCTKAKEMNERKIHQKVAQKSLKYKKCVLLSVAYAANIGGTGTSTSTSPNIVFTQIVNMLYGATAGASYAKWMLFGIPNMITCILVAYGILQTVFMGFKRLSNSKKKAEVAKETLTIQYAKLGTLSFHETSVLMCFTSLVLLFFFRKPNFMPGWENALSPGKVIADAVPAMLMVFVMCAFPANPTEAFDFKSDRPAPSLLSWEIIQQKLPWDLVLLQGSGYALAAGFKESGLDDWLGTQFTSLENIPATALCFIIALLASFVTEVASNASTAAILLPVVAKMAENIQVHPLYFMIPVTICSSFSFMLPIATGPNAMVFKSGKMDMKDMLHVGFITNVACVTTLFLLLNLLGGPIYGLNSFPEWVLSSKPLEALNSTLISTLEIKPKL